MSVFFFLGALDAESGKRTHAEPTQANSLVAGFTSSESAKGDAAESPFNLKKQTTVAFIEVDGHIFRDFGRGEFRFVRPALAADLLSSLKFL